MLLKKLLFTALLIGSYSIASAQLGLLGYTETAWTENKRLEYEYNNYAMNEVQFYISGEIFMKRVLPKVKDTDYNPKGRVTFENGFPYEYFDLKNEAACAFEKESEDKSRLWMRFGPDDDEILEFELTEGTGGDKNKYYYLVTQGDGKAKKLFFVGKEWDLISYSKIRLEVKEKRKSKANVQKTKSKGMKIDGTYKKKKKGGGE